MEWGREACGEKLEICVGAYIEGNLHEADREANSSSSVGNTIVTIVTIVETSSLYEWSNGEANPDNTLKHIRNEIEERRKVEPSTKCYFDDIDDDTSDD